MRYASELPEVLEGDRKLDGCGVVWCLLQFRVHALSPQVGVQPLLGDLLKRDHGGKENHSCQLVGLQQQGVVATQPHWKCDSGALRGTRFAQRPHVVWISGRVSL